YETVMLLYFFFSSRRRHTRSKRDWSSDVCSSDLSLGFPQTIHKAFGNGNIPSCCFRLKRCRDNRSVMLCSPCAPHRDIWSGCIKEHTIPLQGESFFPAQTGI